MQIQVIYFDAQVAHNYSQTVFCLSEKLWSVLFGKRDFMPNQFTMRRYLEKLPVMVCISSQYDLRVGRFLV